MASLNQRLHEAIAAVCPIDGVAIIDPETRQIRVDYRPEATPDQRKAAQVAIDSFDWSDVAQKAADVQSKVSTQAIDPTVQYLLAQIKKAVPDYKIPDAATIAADLARLEP